MTKLKKAPHFDKQAKQCEIVEDWAVLVGKNAHFAYYRNGKEAGKATEWEFIRDVYKFPVDYHPVIISDKLFNEIDFLQLAPTEQMRIKFFQVGDVPTLAKDSNDLKTRILMNLAKHNPKIVAIEWLDQALQGENLYEQLKQIRNGQSAEAEILAANTPEKQDKRQPYIEKRTVNGIAGLYYICPKFDRKTGELLSETEQWLSDFVEVVGIGTSEIETFIILRWTPEGQNTPITEALPLKDLGDREGWRQLRQQGLKIANSSSLRNYLADHLQLSGNRQKWTITHATGWRNGAYKYGLNTSFECLENNKKLSNVKFFSGDFTPENITEEALFYYFPEQIAERFILLLSDDYFDEQAPPKAERLKQIAQIEYEIEELKQEKGELIQTLKEAGIA